MAKGGMCYYLTGYSAYRCQEDHQETAAGTASRCHGMINLLLGLLLMLTPYGSDRLLIEPACMVSRNRYPS
jgi:hypothetical protein